MTPGMTGILNSDLETGNRQNNASIAKKTVAIEAQEVLWVLLNEQFVSY